MNNHSCVIKADPAGGLTFNMVGLNAALCQFILNFVAQRFNLGGRRTGSNNEIIGKNCKVGNVNYFNILAFFAVNGTDSRFYDVNNLH